MPGVAIATDGGEQVPILLWGSPIHCCVSLVLITKGVSSKAVLEGLLASVARSFHTLPLRST